MQKPVNRLPKINRRLFVDLSRRLTDCIQITNTTETITNENDQLCFFLKNNNSPNKDFLCSFFFERTLKVGEETTSI